MFTLRHDEVVDLTSVTNGLPVNPPLVSLIKTQDVSVFCWLMNVVPVK